MKKSIELRQQLSAKVTELRTLVELATTEKRDFSAEEITKRDALQGEIVALEKEVKSAEEVEAILARNAGAVINKANEEKEKREAAEGYSFMRVLRSGLPGNKLEGKELEMHQEAVREALVSGQNISGIGVPGVILRSATVTGGTSGSEGGVLVGTEVMPIIEALRAKLVLTSLGAQTMTGLVGNIDFPSGESTTASWAGENSTATDTSSEMAKKSMSPKRLAATSKISKQLIAQTSQSVEQYVLNDLTNAISEAVESAAISGAGTSNVPTGILSTSGIGSVVGGTNGLIPTWAHIVALESAVSVKNADRGSLGYLTNSKVRGVLKSTLKASGVAGYIWDSMPQTPLNGYNAGVTSLVPSTLTKGTSSACSAIIFGNFNDALLGQWAGLDITVDPYTLAGDGMIKIIVNSFWDVFIKRAESFAAMLDALTA